MATDDLLFIKELAKILMILLCEILRHNYAYGVVIYIKALFYLDYRSNHAAKLLIDNVRWASLTCFSWRSIYKGFFICFKLLHVMVLLALHLLLMSRVFITSAAFFSLTACLSATQPLFDMATFPLKISPLAELISLHALHGHAWHNELKATLILLIRRPPSRQKNDGWLTVMLIARPTGTARQRHIISISHHSARTSCNFTHILCLAQQKVIIP